jgi:hypothetical protein
MLDSVGDIAARQHVDARNRNRAELEAADHRDLPFRQTREHDQDAIAAAYTESLQQIGEAVGEPAHFGKGEAALATLLITPDQRELIRILRPNVNDITAEVEARRNGPAERPGNRFENHRFRRAELVHAPSLHRGGSRALCRVADEGTCHPGLLIAIKHQI